MKLTESNILPLYFLNRSGGLLKLVGGIVVLTGGLAAGTVAYARTNPEFRKQVESNWPILIPILPYIFNEAQESRSNEELPLGSKKPS